MFTLSHIISTTSLKGGFMNSCCSINSHAQTPTAALTLTHLLIGKVHMYQSNIS